MTKDILDELESLGTAQNRKIYMRHGSGAATFGVSFANLRALAKRLKRNHDLAVKLWRTGNSDARALATMVLDPSLLTKQLVESWINDVDYSLLRGLLAGNVAKSPFCIDAINSWPLNKNVALREAGFDLLCHALREGISIKVSLLDGYVDHIVREIHESPNAVRAAMNNALIAIGIYEKRFTEKVLKAARAIGRVEVDHGETSCKTPDAYEYIQRALTRKSGVSRARSC